MAVISYRNILNMEAGDSVKCAKLALDLLIRFLLGGSAVAGCHLLLLVIPWKSFAGIFAAFPAVLASAVIMTGWFEGSRSASELAQGATAGMLGCTVCVAAALLCFTADTGWVWSITLSIPAWLLSSLLFIRLMSRWHKS